MAARLAMALGRRAVGAALPSLFRRTRPSSCPAVARAVAVPLSAARHASSFLARRSPPTADPLSGRRGVARRAKGKRAQDDGFEDLAIEADEEFESDFDEFEEEMAGADDFVQFDSTAAGWGPLAYAEVQRILEGPSFEGIEVYSFRVFSGSRITIRLDDLGNKYGSPGLDTIEQFSRAFNAYMDARVEAEEAPPLYEVEVSSPGAERLVRVPKDLPRFVNLAMKVTYDVPEGMEGGEGGSTSGTEVLELLEVDEEAQMSTWKLAEVKANLPKDAKGRPISKKNLKRRWSLPFASLQTVRMYIEI